MPEQKRSGCNSRTQVTQVVRYMKVLANAERMLVMCSISREPHSVNELQEITGLSQPALSMHLARLREEEMVTTEKSGRHVYYRIGDDRLADLVQYVCQRFSCQ